MRVYVVVSGAPGSGKSSLAGPLAVKLGLPLISKDHIKETLFDSLGVADVDWSQRLGRASYDLLYALAADAGAAVLESNWNPDFAPTGLAALDAPLIEVFCCCPSELARARFADRLSVRHAGHCDDERGYPVGSQEAALGVGPLVSVNTTVPVDITAVANDVRRQTSWPKES